MSSAYALILREAKTCSADDFVLGNGTQFIGHLVKGQSLRYFHKIFAAAQAHEISLAANAFGGSLPREYASFLTDCSGAILFDNVLYIFGYDKVLRRSLEISDQRPVFGPMLQGEFADQINRKTHEGWVAVGSIVLSERIWIALNADGHGALVRSGDFFRFNSFDEIIYYVVQFLSARLKFKEHSVSELKDIEDRFIDDLELFR